MSYGFFLTLFYSMMFLVIHFFKNLFLIIVFQNIINQMIIIFTII